MSKTHKLKVRTARSCWKLLERCCPTSKVKGVRYDGVVPRRRFVRVDELPL